MINNFSRLVKQFIKFGIVGISNTLISLSVTYGFIFLSHEIKLAIDENWLIFTSSFVGFIVSVLNSYYWNNKYVFQKTNAGNLKPLLKSYICYGTTWMLSYFLTFIFADLMCISIILVPILSLIITIPLNFLMNKFWAFK